MNNQKLLETSLKRYFLCGIVINIVSGDKLLFVYRFPIYGHLLSYWV